MEKQKAALNLFTEGKNCAQAVLISFADDLKLDKQTAENLTSGLGAGMGRLHKTCGAVNGSFMVIGMHNSLNASEDEKAEKTNQKIQQLESDFAKKFGSSDCGPIINTDLKTEEGRQYFAENNLKVNICNNCVEYCVDWLEKIWIQSEIYFLLEYSGRWDINTLGDAQRSFMSGLQPEERYYYSYHPGRCLGLHIYQAFSLKGLTDTNKDLRRQHIQPEGLTDKNLGYHRKLTHPDILLQAESLTQHPFDRLRDRVFSLKG